MATLNSYLTEIPRNYLFSDISIRVRDFKEAHPGVEVFRLGVGNTTEPLSLAVVSRMRQKVDSLARPETYTGYGDEQGEEEE